ncbi:metallophosphoesterase [Desulfobacterales bacterium HSG17]|nr:metallophosphoesterase [Desulfobacterales bacterium HSG17]
MGIKTIDYDLLSQRVGEEHLRRRLTRQVDIAAKFYAKGGYASFHIENVDWLHRALEALLKLAGLYHQGQKNAIDYKVEHRIVHLANLPRSFEGYRLLQLSDIHADGIPDGGAKLRAILSGLDADLCVITGDYRFDTKDVHQTAIDRTRSLLNALPREMKIYGILGNHDFIEFVPLLEASGIIMLLNEPARIDRNGSEIWLTGIDDAHIYACHDIPKALTGIPERATTIMLSHTPETYAEAADNGIDYLLCGHTHGGQICLPGGFPVITNAKCPRDFCTGAWQYLNMQGYTSRCTGSSGLPVRFFCPPEITIHEFYRA